ncbi:MAG TPA: nuclear transport factor 2 family protein [Permianibacter sp.]|nr:nuclear transport factor 2 family protein [Permianibacter sp.]
MRVLIGLWLLLSTLSAAAATAAATASGPEADIRSLLADQQAAWNRGDIAGYMQGYWPSPALRFASGGSITYGYDETLQRFSRRYSDRAAMGRLEFEILELLITGEQHAMVFGRWTLHREKDQPGGLFTLMLQKFPGGWKITRDHTSSAD